MSKIIAIIGQPSDIDRTKPNAPEVMLIGGCLRDNPDGANLSKAASPMTYVTPNDAPVLIVHGTEDRTVPLRSGRPDGRRTAEGRRAKFISSRSDEPARQLSTPLRTTE
jgi:hypothetical protein